ncbi:MAG: C40 family peptidase [Pegethrix bostrychoides GSE-TBD4-15B]|jgi:cell wall-associated NlpC family hydrolase|uniref:C40 family peptidase n=1 Tax=Pegethrix bostrychoides GSE-TBD4-15B TaxID=2839662 RepID=A0A951U718_9CYAN|nr:C40 family peptidase [Pegethrix bostrychoides GSE-TBD4-15B]
MVSLTQIQAAQTDSEYQCLGNLNLYDSPALDKLATQAVAGRQFRITHTLNSQAIQVKLCEDDYPGWLAAEDLDLIELAETDYRAQSVAEAEIQRCLPQVIAYCHLAMQQPNRYLWGGAVGPNYDCSGLIQAAFMASGIWLPRDAYQQEAFVQPIGLEALRPADLIFFGTAERATHVGLYLGDGCYIHSSGKAQGRNGIGIDRLLDLENSDSAADLVSQTYMRQIRGAGRVMASYLPV